MPLTYPLPLMAGKGTSPKVTRAGELLPLVPHWLRHSRERALHLTWVAQKNWPWMWGLLVSLAKACEWESWPCLLSTGQLCDLERDNLLPSLISHHLWQSRRAGSEVLRLGELALSLNGGHSWESGLCGSSGQRDRDDSG